MVSESKAAIEDRLSPTLQKVLTVALAIIGSLDGVLIIAKFVQQNIHLMVGLFVIAVVMIGVAWLMFVRQLWLVLVVILGVSIVALIPLWIWVANTEIEPINVTITDPQDSGPVTLRYLVKGEVSAPMHKFTYSYTHLQHAKSGFKIYPSWDLMALGKPLAFLEPKHWG